MSQADAEPITAESFAAFATFLGTPLPDNPIRALRILRKEAAAEIERLLAFLDVLSGDEDLEDTADEEPDLGWSERYGQGPRVNTRSAPDFQHHPDGELDLADEEPALASPENHCTAGDLYSPTYDKSGSQTRWAQGNYKDLEGERIGEDDEDSDHSGIGDMGGYSEQLNGEPDLGATEAFSHVQAWRAQEDEWHATDGEPDFASTSAEDASGKHPPTSVKVNEVEQAVAGRAVERVGPTSPHALYRGRNVAHQLLEDNGLWGRSRSPQLIGLRKSTIY